MSDSYLSAQDVSHSPNGYPNASDPSFAPSNVPSVPTIRKKLMGYVGFANLPNQVHRKSVRKGFQFTAMVVGAFLFSRVPPLHFLTLLPRVQASRVSENPPS
jgi:septin 7